MLRKAKNLIRNLMHGRAQDSELDAELRGYAEMLADEKMRAGMKPEEARRAAQIDLGGVEQVKEQVREARAGAWLDSLFQDVRYGARMLRKSPGFTIVAVLTLALGIGANTALFSVVNGVLLTPLSYPHSDRLVAVAESSPPFLEGSISYPDFVDWTKMNHTFDALAAYRHGDFNLTGWGDAEHLKVTQVSAAFFPLLGVQPIAGRAFTPDDDKIGAVPTVMLSEQLWRGKFGASLEIVGKALTLDGSGYTVIGVVPAGFYFCCETTNFQLGDAYMTIGSQKADWVTERGDSPGIFAIGRLKARASLQNARADMDSVARDLAAAYPATDKNSRVVLAPLIERMTRPVKGAILILFASVGFVLLIACTNVANLLLARSTGRAREFAVRAALGGTRRRVMRQLLTESLLLAITGGTLGVLLAMWGTQAALTALPKALPRANDVGMDLRVLCFTVTVSILSGVLFGLAPAFRSSSPDLQDTLKKGGRGSSGARHQTTQSILVVTELALAVVLLIGAGLTIRSLAHVWAINPGFDPHNVLAFDVSLPSAVAGQPADQIRAYLQSLPDEVAKIPGVQSVTISDGADPLNGDSELKFWVDGHPKPSSENDMPLALSYLVGPDYLKTLKIPLLNGRFLSRNDTNPSEIVGVVDEDFARTYFPGQDPVGRYIRMGYKDIPIRIVGVVGHVKQWGLDETGNEPLNAQLYTLAAQMPDAWIQGMGTVAGVGVRTDAPGYPTPAVIRSTLAKINSEQVAYDFITMDRVISQSLTNRRFTAILLGCFAGAALLLAGIGIYGVMAYLVTQRTHEFGVRVALGASVNDVVKIVLARGVKLACAGVVVGVAAAFGLTKLISSLLFGVTPHDPLTFAAVAILLTLITLAACYVPARRAMRVDPVVALRHE